MKRLIESNTDTLATAIQSDLSDAEIQRLTDLKATYDPTFDYWTTDEYNALAFLRWRIQKGMVD